jgi:hypothetical protein
VVITHDRIADGLEQMLGGRARAHSEPHSIARAFRDR